MITEKKFTIEQSHTDELGHLNHVWALKLIEFARDEWYAKAGLWGGRPWSDDETLGTIVVNINADYRKECFAGESVVVRSQPLVKGNKSYTIKQQLVKRDGEVAVDCVTTNVIMDMNSHELVIVPNSIGRHYKAQS